MKKIKILAAKSNEKMKYFKFLVVKSDKNFLLFQIPAAESVEIINSPSLSLAQTHAAKSDQKTIPETQSDYIYYLNT